MSSNDTSLRVLTAGGSVSPGDLQQLSQLAQDYGLTTLEFGNRQELILSVERKLQREDIARRIRALGLATDEPDQLVQNLVSSLPAAELFPNTDWLTGGVYLDVLAQFKDWLSPPHLKINIIDPAQPLVSPLTGNINFVASPEPNYWYVLLRPSGSVRRYAWPILIETESVGAFAQVVEKKYFPEEKALDSAPSTRGQWSNPDEFYRLVMAEFQGRTRNVSQELVLPTAGVPVYEGFHPMRSGNYWLGLYRRNNLFPLPLIGALCELCRQTRVGKMYLTPYKTLVIKDIRPEDRPAWDRLLGRFGVRTNVPVWHLNWQLPNADANAVALKNQVLRQIEETDVRTDDLSFAVNLPFSEAAASVVIQVNGAPDRFDVYQRTYQSVTNAQYVLFAKSRPLAQLGDVVQQLSQAYYERLSAPVVDLALTQPEAAVEYPRQLVYECPHCQSRYDPRFGEPHRHIAVGTLFAELPGDFSCGLCEAEKNQFTEKWIE